MKVFVVFFGVWVTGFAKDRTSWMRYINIPSVNVLQFYFYTLDQDSIQLFGYVSFVYFLLALKYQSLGDLSISYGLIEQLFIYIPNLNQLMFEISLY